MFLHQAKAHYTIFATQTPQPVIKQITEMNPVSTKRCIKSLHNSFITIDMNTLVIELAE